MTKISVLHITFFYLYIKSKPKLEILLTFQETKRLFWVFAKAKGILLIILFYIIYKYLVKDYDLEYKLIAIFSIISLITIIRVEYIARAYYFKGKKKPIHWLESIPLDLALFIITGGLVIYLSVVKGIYGIYKAFFPFSFIYLIFRIIIFILTTVLLRMLSKIQGTYTFIKDRSF